MSAKPRAISVRGLGKSYRIDHTRSRTTTFRDLLMSRLRHPLRRGRTETFWALQDIDFEIAQGDVVGIIGRNGAGKSTLLKVLSRITEPTAGCVDLYGRVGSLLEVGTGFHPELTGRENIFLNGAILGMRRREIAAQFDAIVDFAEVEKFLDTPVKHYSSGMYVRLAFAVAAHLNPEILIVDEVLAVGDAEFQKKCLGKMGEVSRVAGRTVLFVSHNLSAVRQLCTRAILLDGGTVVMDSTTADVADKYLELGAKRAQRIQDAPNNATGYRDVRIVDVDGRPLTAVSPDEPSFVELNVSVRPRSGVTAGFTLYNQENVPLILSNASDSVQLQAGDHVYRVRLPGELLKPGPYRIEGAVWDAAEVYHQEDELHRFEVIPSRGHNPYGRWSAAHFVLREPWVKSDPPAPRPTQHHLAGSNP